MSVLNTLQYKQCLSILTLPKCNASFIDQIFTISRTQKSQMVQIVQIQLSINSNTIRSEIHILMLTFLDTSEICSMIQKLNSYNLLTDKVTEKVP